LFTNNSPLVRESLQSRSVDYRIQPSYFTSFGHKFYRETEMGRMNMQFYFGHQMPLRVLDEAEFWKKLEEEHTVVIRELLEDLEEKYVDALAKWEESFSRTYQQIIRYIQSVNRSPYYVPTQLNNDVLQLVYFCLQESLGFIILCQQIKTESEAVSKNPTAKVVLDHIIRESEYFVGIAQVLLYNKHHQPS
jgi:hypothetical protein